MEHVLPHGSFKTREGKLQILRAIRNELDRPLTKFEITKIGSILDDLTPTHMANLARSGPNIYVALITNFVNNIRLHEAKQEARRIQTYQEKANRSIRRELNTVDVGDLMQQMFTDMDDSRPQRTQYEFKKTLKMYRDKHDQEMEQSAAYLKKTKHPSYPVFQANRAVHEKLTTMSMGQEEYHGIITNALRQQGLHLAPKHRIKRDDGRKHISLDTRYREVQGDELRGDRVITDYIWQIILDTDSDTGAKINPGNPLRNIYALDLHSIRIPFPRDEDPINNNDARRFYIGIIELGSEGFAFMDKPGLYYQWIAKPTTVGDFIELDTSDMNHGIIEFDNNLPKLDKITLRFYSPYSLVEFAVDRFLCNTSRYSSGEAGLPNISTDPYIVLRTLDGSPHGLASGDRVYFNGYDNGIPHIDTFVNRPGGHVVTVGVPLGLDEFWFSAVDIVGFTADYNYSAEGTIDYGLVPVDPGNPDGPQTPSNPDWTTWAYDPYWVQTPVEQLFYPPTSNNLWTIRKGRNVTVLPENRRMIINITAHYYPDMEEREHIPTAEELRAAAASARASMNA